jgi:hypothetical protein
MLGDWRWSWAQAKWPQGFARQEHHCCIIRIHPSRVIEIMSKSVVARPP